MSTSSQQSVKVLHPAWARELFDPETVNGKPVRYRVAYGGRAGAKSWEFARQLIVRAAREKLRVLCTREYQRSIKDSVHRVLRDQVSLLRMDGNYDVGEAYLRSHIGSEFIYKGLRYNVDEVKSTEGLDIAWVEEAHTTSAQSWEVLIPTIRKPGSEIWVSFNPDQDDDPTYKRFIENPPDNAIVVKVGFQDNPWVSDETLEEMEYLKRVDYEAYLHVWEGFTRTHTDAQVLKGKYRSEAFEPEGFDGPYFGADWGFSVDPTVLIKCWVHDKKLYIEHEAYGIGVETDDLPELFGRIDGAKDHVIRADNARPENVSYVKRHGFSRITSCSKWPGSVEDGVSKLRSFEEIIIHPRCKHTAEEARLWSYKTDRLTGDVLPELVDKHNHCWDAIRYAIEPLIQRKTESKQFNPLSIGAL